MASSSEMPEARPRHRRPKQQANPLKKGILLFLAAKRVTVQDHVSPQEDEQPTLRIADLPKRFTIYPPLLLLPYNFRTHSPPWQVFYEALSEEEKAVLLRHVVEGGFEGMGISRVAINAPIAADEIGDAQAQAEASCGGTVKTENVLRSPSHLLPIFGDWGAAKTTESGSKPATEDFERAFWVSASQHRGITQCWAPIYTMFSRGNVSEKARILGVDAGLGQSRSSFQGLAQSELGEDVNCVDVVDFYVGIGYFAFCYLQRDVRTVWGWDINPWSIEGLRRGCEANGWRCLVVLVDNEGRLQGMTVRELAEIWVESTTIGGGAEIRCVAFLGDNKWSVPLMLALHEELKARSPSHRGLNVRHANMGLLPSSRGTWEHATVLSLKTDARAKGSWLHVHENVDIIQIDAWKVKVVHEIETLTKLSDRGSKNRISCVGVHEVKTYAPGVMHCVFDIQIKPYH
ncbi:hypothetical protein LTR84_011277 [Exophiala bonariae]|uniref:tRNA wybutosine-synthesizing protein 2 n=1 Tax=Exophiala bonariae TaxID=1690606 RepID=A0AAV9MTW1_9EURO|nr:hypothetical protein LTR84_011277 [Exophiala bonariae]